MDNKNMLFIPNRKKRSYFRTSDVVFLVIVTCVVTFNMSFLFSIAKGTNFESSENSKYLNEFIKEYNRIVDNYYGDLDEDALIDGALEGLIDALPDDYSSTLDNSESNNYDTHLEGTYEGIGIEIVNDTDNNIIIYSSIENSPASKADLKVGDIVLGKSLVQHDFDVTAFNHNKGYIPGVGESIDADEYLLSVSRKVLEKEDVDYKVGVIASGDIFCTETWMSEKINKKFNALCVEMEGASIAQICYLSHIPFLVLRSISHTPNNDNRVTYEEFLESSSKTIAKAMVCILQKPEDNAL